MPMIGKQEFIRQKPPADIKPGEELFFCKHTKEVFRNYEDLFQRVILCDSLAWTCSLSGRIGLTFQEALRSEENVRAILKAFPNSLKRPIMQLVRMSKKSSYADLADELFNFARNRYFIGEEVDAVVNGEKKQYRISKVIPAVKSTKKMGSSNEESEVRIYSDEAEKFKYQLVELMGSRQFIVSADAVSRPKGLYTRDKNRLFIRQCVELTGLKTLKLKDVFVEKYNMKDFTYKKMFSGPKPPFGSSLTKIKKKKVLSSPNTNSKVGSHQKNVLLHEGSPPLKTKKSVQKEQDIKELMKKNEERNKKRKELREKEKERKQEERKILAAFVVHWKQPREDLECDNLEELPLPTAVDCSIPSESFGDILMILEFFHHYGSLISGFKSCFYQGLTLDLVLKVLCDTDIVSPFADIVHLLFLAILKQQEDNEVEREKEGIADEISKEDLLIREATNVATSFKQCHGTILRRMPLDPFTLSELLRLHLLSSGAVKKNQDFRSDPGLSLKENDSQIVECLSVSTIYELPAGQWKFEHCHINIRSYVNANLCNVFF